MRITLLSKLSLALGAAALLAIAGPARAVTPPVSSSPDTDAFRTGGCTGCFLTQMTAAVVQFSNITRVFRACYANAGGGTKIVDDGSGCADGTHGRIADFVVLQGTLKDKNTDPNGLGVPNGPALGEVTYRVSANGSGNGIGCAAASSPVGTGFLAPEGLDGVPGDADDAGGTGSFGVVGAGVNAGTATMSAAPLTACVNKTGIEKFDTIGTTTMSFHTPTTELCVVNFDLSGDGNVQNDQTGAGTPSQFPLGSNIHTVSATNETTNLKLTCDTAFSDLPTGDFLPPKAPYNGPDVFGAQIFKLVASRDVHSITGGADAKIHLNDPQIEGIFGDPANNSVCQLKHIGATSAATSNVTACIRAAGSGTRETFRLTWMADTEGSKNQSEDTAGGSNGTVTACSSQVKEGGGLTLTGSKRVKVGNGNADVVNCLNAFSGGFGYVDADRFDDSTYAVVVEGVDPDSAIQAAPSTNLKQLVKCGHWRWWGPLAGGLGQHNGGASDFITAHRGALKNSAVYANAVAYVPLGANTGVGFTKGATDGSYSIQFVPTSCPAAPPAEDTISASPTTLP